MKKSLIAVGAFALATLSSTAAILLNEPFSYADGSITAVSGGVWTNHSGTAGQVDVASGAVNLTQAESEDVSAGLASGPHTTGYLYASFKINLSTLPVGAGGYFFHFRDSGTINHRARTFVTTTGAETGSYRVGIAAGGNTPVVIAKDLSLSTEYKLVVRYDAAAATATLWIDPLSEASAANRADSTDSTTVISVLSACLRQSTATGNGMGVLTLDDLLVGTAFTDVQTPPEPPAISAIPNASIAANSNTGPIPFLVEDGQTAAGSLTVSAISDNPTLVPNNPANLTFGGGNNNRTITVTPAAGQQGVANIQVTVEDGDMNTASTSFAITVGEPGISTIPDQLAITNTVSGPVAFTVNDSETAPGSLAVTATSDNTSVLPNENIGIQNLGGQNRSIIMTNIGPGVANVTVTVNDGVFDRSTAFTLTAYPNVGIVLADNFDYADGVLTNTSGGFWTNYSGTSGDVPIAGGQIELSSSRGHDVQAFLTNSPYANADGYVFFARFIVTYNSLPSAGGEYFALFKDAGSTQFRGRIFGTTAGAAAGSYRLGIANGTTPTVFPQDLQLDTPYVVISRYNLATAQNSVLWVNPASEASPSVTATDSANPINIYSYAFRQNSGIGTLKVDNLKVASTFNDVFTTVATPGESLHIELVGGNIMLTWDNPLFSLQAAPFVAGTYTNVPGAASGYTTAPAGGQMFFRLAN